MLLYFCVLKMLEFRVMLLAYDRDVAAGPVTKWRRNNLHLIRGASRSAETDRSIRE